jgi:hypothetical protein
LERDDIIAASMESADWKETTLSMHPWSQLTGARDDIIDASMESADWKETTL